MLIWIRSLLYISIACLVAFIASLLLLNVSDNRNSSFNIPFTLSATAFSYGLPLAAILLCLLTTLYIQCCNTGSLCQNGVSFLPDSFYPTLPASMLACFPLCSNYHLY